MSSRVGTDAGAVTDADTGTDTDADTVTGTVTGTGADTDAGADTGAVTNKHAGARSDSSRRRVSLLLCFAGVGARCAQVGSETAAARGSSARSGPGAAKRLDLVLRPELVLLELRRFKLLGRREKRMLAKLPKTRVELTVARLDQVEPLLHIVKRQRARGRDELLHCVHLQRVGCSTHLSRYPAPSCTARQAFGP
ncbi:MAG: hypothetical protein L6Q76_14070 [Polyangiaceae bacterium]|nr:hypothetical protein [Polyangiaceae bacterium]